MKVYKIHLKWNATNLIHNFLSLSLFLLTPKPKEWTVFEAWMPWAKGSKGWVFMVKTASASTLRVLRRWYGGSLMSRDPSDEAWSSVFSVQNWKIEEVDCCSGATKAVSVWFRFVSKSTQPIDVSIPLPPLMYSLIISCFDLILGP